MTSKKKQTVKVGQNQELFPDLFVEPKQSKPPKPKNNRSENQDGKKVQFSSMADLLSKHQVQEKNKYVSQEFQSYGCYLANELNDKKFTSLYIKLAKNTSRGLLERALSFVSDADNAKSKGKLFMWKLKELKKEQQARSSSADKVKPVSLGGEKDVK